MARIIHFPRAAPRRLIAYPPAPVRYVVRRRSWVHSAGFGLLLSATIPAAFLYLSGAVNVARHDTLYAALLAVVWGMYFTSDKLSRTRVGTLLMRAGLLLALAGVAGFFGGIYWLIWSHP